MNSKRTLYIIIGILSITVLFFVIIKFKSSPKFAFINNGVIMNEYLGIIDSKKEYEKKAKVWQSNIDTLTASVQQAIQQYEKKVANGSAKEKQLAEDLIGTKKRQMMQYQKAIEQKAQQEEVALTQKEVEEINRFVKEYGKKNGYTIIFGATNSGNIVYADEVMDITKDVLEGLNKNYKR